MINTFYYNSKRLKEGLVKLFEINWMISEEITRDDVIGNKEQGNYWK